MTDVSRHGLGGPDHFQQAVIGSGPTNLLVRSCAGSGKSTTLAARAANLISHGVSPERILVLTFSVRSKEDLEAKMRLVLLGGGTAPRVRTHHAHALSILRAAGCSARVVDAAEQRKIMKKALGVDGAPRDQVREAVRSGLTAVARSKGSQSVPPAGSREYTLLEAYQSALRAAGAMDFEDMILLAAQALRQVGPSIEPHHEHLLLDEAQDTSESQFNLLKLLAPRGQVAVTAVGDADQTIYSFRGSRPDVLARIGSWWQCQTLVLPTNYRCGGAVVEAARSLIEASSLRDDAPPLLAARNLAHLGSVVVHEHATRDEERRRLADELRSLQLAAQSDSSRWPTGGVAVLCRTRAQVAEMTNALKDASVRTASPKAVGDSSNSTARQRSLDVLSYVRLCLTPEDDDAFETAMQLPPRSGWSPNGSCFAYLKTVQRFMPAKTTNGGNGGARPGLLAAAHAAASRGFPSVSGLGGGVDSAQSLTRPQQSSLRGFLELLKETRERAARTSPVLLLEWLIERTKLGEHLDRARKNRKKLDKAFTVKVPGEPMSGRGGGAADSSEEDDDDDDDEEDQDGGGVPTFAHHHQPSPHLSSAKHALSDAFHAGPTASPATTSSTANAAITSLLRMARQINSSVLSAASPPPHPSHESGVSGGKQAYDNLSAFTDELLMASHEAAAAETSSGKQSTSTAVLCTTLHQAKGLEYDLVYLPYMTEGSVPLLPRGIQPNTLEYIEHIEEERRLCYVGYTRADPPAKHGWLNCWLDMKT